MFLINSHIAFMSKYHMAVNDVGGGLCCFRANSVEYPWFLLQQSCQQCLIETPPVSCTIGDVSFLQDAGIDNVLGLCVSTGKEISKPADTFDEFSWLIFYLRLFAFFCFNFFYEQFQQLFLCAYTIVHSGEKFLHNFFLVSENLFSHNRTNKSFIYCTMFFEKFLSSSYINMNFRYTPHTFYFQKA